MASAKCSAAVFWYMVSSLRDDDPSAAWDGDSRLKTTVFPPRSDSRRRSRRDRRPVLGTGPAILRRLSKLHSTRSRHRNMVGGPDPRARSCRDLNDIENYLRMPDNPRSLSSHGSVPGVRRGACEPPVESNPNRPESAETLVPIQPSQQQGVYVFALGL